MNKIFLAKTAVFATMITATLVPSLALADTLTHQLDLGMSGSDVSSVQTFLGRDASLYPQNLVTGYFGSLTAQAVSRFQTRNSLPSVGRVGPMTLVVLNQQMSGGTTVGDNQAPIISPVNLTVSRTSVSVNYGTSEFARGVVYYSTSPLSLSNEQLNSVSVSGAVAMTDSSVRTAQSIVLGGLNPNTTYYYAVYVTDQSGNVSMTWPAIFQTSL